MSFWLAIASVSRAEGMCTTQVWYQWHKEKENEARKQVVLHTHARGGTATEAKEALLRSLPPLYSRAAEACRRTHMRSAHCIAERLQALRSTLLHVSFSARKALEERVTQDCALDEGECTHTGSEEPQCAEQQPPAAEGSEKGEVTGKDKKTEAKK
jgi:hypothetical protein